jgi:hypothetical protein
MVRLFPVFFPLLLVRGLERAEFERKEEGEGANTNCPKSHFSFLFSS